MGRRRRRELDACCGYLPRVRPRTVVGQVGYPLLLERVQTACVPSTSGGVVMTRVRASSVVWGPAMRHAIHTALAANDPPLSQSHMRVLLVALELTASWRKMDDRTVRSVIARQASVSERTASRGLSRLHDLGALEWRPSKARGQLGLLSLKHE